MGAQILELASARPGPAKPARAGQVCAKPVCTKPVCAKPDRAGRAYAPPPSVAEQAHRDAIKRAHFWRGASKKRYIHTVYDLIDCPDLPQANYLLVRCDADGRRRVLRIGQTSPQAGSLNLARIRECAARLGANEVHVHLLQETDKGRMLVELDLRAGLFASLSAQPC